MSISDRKQNLIMQIQGINSEQTLEMLESSLAFYSHAEGRDITDGLNEYQLNEPDDKDTISEDEFRKLFARWNTK